jgi:hypothetical protein
MGNCHRIFMPEVNFDNSDNDQVLERMTEINRQKIESDKKLKKIEQELKAKDFELKKRSKDYQRVLQRNKKIAANKGERRVSSTF